MEAGQLSMFNPSDSESAHCLYGDVDQWFYMFGICYYSCCVYTLYSLRFVCCLSKSSEYDAFMNSGKKGKAQKLTLI